MLAELGAKDSTRMLYPWELTAQDWIGPRFQPRMGNRMNRSKVAWGAWPSEPFEHLRVEFVPGDDLFAVVFDADEKRVVGSIGWDHATIESKHRGTGILARIAGERFYRFGRSEFCYMRQAVYGALTDDGLKMVRRVHEYAVRKKQARDPGSVMPGVLESLDLPLDRYPAQASDGLVARLRAVAPPEDFALFERWHRRAA